MNKPNGTGLAIGIIGGIGLGLLLGSEFAGTFTTLSGALLVIVLLVSIGLQFLTKSQRLDRADTIIPETFRISRKR
jgi:hypothetical protein